MKQKIVVMLIMVICLLVGCGDADTIGEVAPTVAEKPVESKETQGASESVTAPIDTKEPIITEEPELEVIPTPEPTEKPIINEVTPVPHEGIVNANGKEDNHVYIDKENTDESDYEHNVELIKQTIINDCAKYNQFIYDHLGYSEEEFGPGPNAIVDGTADQTKLSVIYGVMWYMDNIIDYAGNDFDNTFTNSFGTYIGSRSSGSSKEEVKFMTEMQAKVSIDTVIKEVRYAIFHQKQYHDTVVSNRPNRCPEYQNILANFLEDQHPDILTIDEITIKDVSEEGTFFDDYLVHAIATFTSEGETYVAYINCISSDVFGNCYYQLLDLDRQ